MLFLMLAAVLAALVYFKVTNAYKYWQIKGVPYVKPFLIFGNLAPNLFRRRAFANLLQDMYNLYPNERYIGIFQFLQPILMIRDPNLIKQIAVQDFDVFPNHNLFATGEADPLFDKNLFSMKSKLLKNRLYSTNLKFSLKSLFLTGEDGWHDMRTTLSPFFTSSKMKTMFALIQQRSSQFVNYFKNQKGVTTLELKDAFTRFTNDVFATIAFGITCDSLKNRVNEFYLMGKDASDFSGVRLIKIFCYAVIPSVMKLFKIKFLSSNVRSFFTNLIKETVRIRKANNIVRPDMIHLLMEARKEQLKQENQNNTLDSSSTLAQGSRLSKSHKGRNIEITDEVLVAQALVFFIAGFETASTLMCYTAYELAINPDIQDKLYQEMKKVVDQCNGEITYESLLGMKYLDKVITESLRRHPVSQLTDRISIKPYTIQPQQPGEKPVLLDKGSIIWIPTYAIHLDPKNYPDPEIFDPERFSEENKHNVQPFTFIPFGAGPRNCIGYRLALLESKLIIVELLRHFEFVRVEKTQVHLQLSKSNPSPLPEEGLWIGLKPR